MTESIISIHQNPIAVLDQPVFPSRTHTNAIIVTIVVRPIGKVPQNSPDDVLFIVAKKIPFHLNTLTTLAAAIRMKRTTLKMNTTTPRRRNQPALKGKVYRRTDVMPVPILKEKNAGEMFNIAYSTRLITRLDRLRVAPLIP